MLHSTLFYFYFFGRDKKRQTLNFSSGSSDNGAASPEEMLERPHMLDKQSSTER